MCKLVVHLTFLSEGSKLVGVEHVQPLQFPLSPHPGHLPAIPKEVRNCPTIRPTTNKAEEIPEDTIQNMEEIFCKETDTQGCCQHLL